MLEREPWGDHIADTDDYWRGWRDATDKAVEEIAYWLMHIDRLDEIPGAADSMPERNPLWDAAQALLREAGQRIDESGRRTEPTPS